MIERFPVTDRASWLERRKQDVTASTVAALFGCHPYMTAYQLFALKSGLVSESTEETPAMRRGRLLEPIAIQMLAEERPDWVLSPSGVYLRDPELGLGATPDVDAWRPDIPGKGTVQIKTAGHFSFKKGWKSGEDVEVPLWIVLQNSVEAMLDPDVTWAAVAVMTLGDGGLDMYIEDVPLRPQLMIRTRELTKEFWQRIKENRPYDPDFGKDADTIKDIYRDDGGTIDLSRDNRMAEIVSLRDALKAREADGNAAEKERKILDVEILTKLGNAANARLPDGRMLSASIVKVKERFAKAYQYPLLKVK